MTQFYTKPVEQAFAELTIDPRAYAVGTLSATTIGPRGRVMYAERGLERPGAYAIVATGKHLNRPYGRPLRDGRALYVGCAANVGNRVRSHIAALTATTAHPTSWVNRVSELQRLLPCERRNEVVIHIGFTPEPVDGRWWEAEIARFRVEAELVVRYAPVGNARCRDNPFIVYGMAYEPTVPEYLGDGVYQIGDEKRTRAAVYDPIMRAREAAAEEAGAA